MELKKYEIRKSTRQIIARTLSDLDEVRTGCVIHEDNENDLVASFDKEETARLMLREYLPSVKTVSQNGRHVINVREFYTTATTYEIDGDGPAEELVCEYLDWNELRFGICEGTKTIATYDTLGDAVRALRYTDGKDNVCVYATPSNNLVWEAGYYIK